MTFLSNQQRRAAFTKFEVFGLILLIIFVVAIFRPSVFPADTRAKVSRAQDDMRSVATALEAFYDHHGFYPASAVGKTGNSFAPPNSTSPTLTTPVAYLSDYFRDPFTDPEYTTYRYFANDYWKKGYFAGTNGILTDKKLNGWLLWSPGPDRDYDIDPTADYNAQTPHPSRSLIRKTYDPTNGTTSNGDVWRAKQ